MEQRNTGTTNTLRPEAGDPTPLVLVIDDDDVQRAAMCEVLADRRIESIALQSPIGATQLAMTRNVDVVLLDVMMPNVRGDMLAKLFRRNRRLQHVGVILVSSCSSEELQNLARECEADAVVTKGRVRSDLFAVVSRVFGLTRLRRATNK